MASRTESFNASPLQGEDKAQQNKETKTASRSAEPAWRSIDDRLNELRPSSRDLAGIVVEEADSFESIHGSTEAPVAQSAPVHALNALKSVLVNIRQRIAVVELFQLVCRVHVHWHNRCQKRTDDQA
jgi:hypothetical protein